MSNKIIVTCAVAGSAETYRTNPAVPITPEQIATAALDAERAGASKLSCGRGGTFAFDAAIPGRAGEGSTLLTAAAWRMSGPAARAVQPGRRLAELRQAGLHERAERVSRDGTAYPRGRD